jgi:hypothetical protein
MRATSTSRPATSALGPTGVVPRFCSVPRLVVFAAVLALAIAAPAVGASSGPVKGASYKGLVGPGYPLSFRVSPNGKSLESLAAGFESTCVPGPSIAPVYRFPTIAVKGDSFSGETSKHAPKQSFTLAISGHFSGRTASGKIVEKLKIKSLHTCVTTMVFTATAK